MPEGLYRQGWSEENGDVTAGDAKSQVWGQKWLWTQVTVVRMTNM